MMSDSPARCELLSPAGDELCLRAAVENGADAVYFGLNHGFNARARATNFELSDVPRHLEFLHQRGVKGYVTLNTLIFTDELPELEQTVRALAQAGADAVLVQDLGLARLIKAICPQLPIHASTQMTLTSAECLAVAADLGIERVVLPRELSVAEIRAIGQQSTIPLEAFVHGALCVAYSGQCLTSESLGGRSANRGQCAQACRLPYDLICDGEPADLGAQQYLLSPQDLAAYALIPELIAAGVTSFKIEGRLKTPEYVANITHHYRQALDAALAERALQFSAEEVREMELSFSRGFSTGWLNGCDHKALVPGMSSAKRGICLGTIRRVLPESVEVELSAPVTAGDGVVFAGPGADAAPQGGRVYTVRVRGRRIEEEVTAGLVELEFAREGINFDLLQPGQEVWKTDDPRLTAKWRRTFTGADPLRKIPVEMLVTAGVGQPLAVAATLPDGRTVQAETVEPLSAARTRPLTMEFLREQLARMGHTAFELKSISADITGEPMIPLSVLSELRRRLVTQLEGAMISRSGREINGPGVLEQMRSRAEQAELISTEPAPRIRLLCRTLDQVRSAVAADISEVYADFADIRLYHDAVQLARSAGVPIFLAPPRIQKPGEVPLFHALRKNSPDGLLVRNLSGLNFCREYELPAVADYSLNVTNELTAQWLIERGAARLTASYDLNREQLLEMLRAAPPSWFEVVIHQHMPMFHMEHCVFCAVLSPGTNKTNCGRPCDDHRVQLRDRIGMEHLLTADVGCRNTLFNALPQSAAEAIPELLSLGVRDFRIELLEETPRELQQMLTLYRELLAGRRGAADVFRELRAANRVGITRGTLEDRRNPLAIL